MQPYIDFVEKLAKTGQDELFFNSSPAHASIVMSRIFKYASKEVLIFCGGFNGTVSNDEEYLKYLDSFLQRGKLKILVEQDLSNNDESKIFKVLRKHRNNVEIYQTTSKISDTESNQHLHFAVGDDKMLRLETDIENYVAQVNFGNKEDAIYFTGLFNKVWAGTNKKQVALA